MINDIAPHLFKNEMSFRTAEKDDFLLVFHGDKVLLQESQIPKVSDISKKILLDMEDLDYLFSIDGKGYFLLRGSNTDNLCSSNPGGEFVSIQSLRTLEPRYTAFAIMTAGQLYRWMEKHKFCGCCGGSMSKSSAERALICDQCGETIYLNISPAVAVAIINGDKILLARNSYGTFRKFALIAGYMEMGESFEETVKREVMEEVGLKIKNIRYYKSQPWGATDCEMVGFFVDLDGDDTITRQESEIAEARWFTREELEPDVSRISLSYEMIEQFRLNTYPR